MSGALLRLLLLNVGLAALGLGLLPLLGLVRTRRELLRRAGLSHLVGVAAVGIVGTNLALVGVPFRLPLLAVLVVASLAGGAARLRRLDIGPRARDTPRVGWLAALAGGVALIVLLAQAARAYAVHPLQDWDAWAIWSLKARGLFELGDAHNAIFTSQAYALSHLDYPLLLPSLEALSFRSMGGLHATVLHVQLWLLAASFAAALVTVLAGRTPVEVVVAALLLLFAAPVPLMQLETGYADMPLALLAGVGLAALARYVLTGERFALHAAALFLAAAALTKNEGGAFALAALAAAGIVLAVAARERLRPLGLATICLLAVVLPWRVFAQAHGGPIDYRLGWLVDPGYLAGHTDRLRPAAHALWGQMTVSTWGSAVTAVVAGALCAVAARRLALLAFGALFLALGFAALLATYWVSVTDNLGNLLIASAYRVVDTLLVGGVVLAAVAAGEAWRLLLPGTAAAPAEPAAGAAVPG